MAQSKTSANALESTGDAVFDFARLMRLLRRARPVQLWWIGVALFFPSLLLWACSIVTIAWYLGGVTYTFDGHGVTHIHVPLCAAVLGVCLPVACLRRLRTASWRVTTGCFALYLAVMLTWGWFDVRNENYQVGGHDYPNGILADGHKHYWHLYFTWYFLPYRWIHGYEFGA